MIHTERKIFDQYKSLSEIFRYLQSSQIRLLLFSAKARTKREVFAGCGSSYSVAKSAAAAADTRLPVPAYSLAAGDLLLRFPLSQPP